MEELYSEQNKAVRSQKVQRGTIDDSQRANSRQTSVIRDHRGSRVNSIQNSRRREELISPNKKKTKKEESSLNFKRWLLTLVSIGNFILAPLIIYMGYQASQYDYNDLLIVDKALMALGSWVIVISIGSLIAVNNKSNNTMLFVMYNCIVTFILLSVFAIGAISFGDDLLDWIDKHWEEIRATASQYSMQDFKQHAASELVSLGAFSLTINISMFIMITTIVLIQGLDRVMKVLFPLTNLLQIIFSIAIFIVGLYFNLHLYYTSALPLWAASYTLYLIALFVLGMGITGYYSVTHGRFASLLAYILGLSLSAFVSLVTGLAMVLKTANIKEAVKREWPEIQARLKAAGYEVLPESTFSNFLEVNLKFGGLFVIVFCLFLIMGLIPAIYMSVVIRRGQSDKGQAQGMMTVHNTGRVGSVSPLGRFYQPQHNQRRTAPPQASANESSDAN
ncbi:hypothetical protein FGO68_gene13057 [Halteria grandinella]|uniref:Uncharacterized protein n=1 Tax=Halteria grandinella TaxID=5974 RepID=A0A8J8NMW5_HALGN|nr:hypothetical protein FGO68_gene13057 [Halteria grandinella]